MAIDRKNKGDPLYAAEVNQLAQLANKLNTIKAGSGITIRNFPSGIYISATPAKGGLFPVLLSMDGGADGDGFSSASWTYTATDLYENELGTELSPDKPRPLGVMQTASKGVGYYGTDGTFALAQAYEVESMDVCVPISSSSSGGG